MTVTLLETKAVASSMIDALGHPANVMTEAAELVTKTMGEIVAKQTDLLRIENKEIAEGAAALGQAGESVTVIEDYVAAMRGGVEGALSNLRDIQDLMRGCAWGLFGLYLDSISIAAGNGRPSRH